MKSITKPGSPGLQDAFPEPGDIFFEQFRIDSVLNRGGFGCVYEATQLRLDRKVAVKVLQPASRIGFDDDADARRRRLKIVEERFRREAKLVSRLRDPNTVRMHDYGTTEAGLLFMVLEFVEGRPLSDVLAEDGPLDPARCTTILRRILQSLEEAHAIGMLHRDIKPQNIMVFDHIGRADQVKVLDFGLAKSIDDPAFTADNPDLTDDDVLIGTPRYMAPEQIRGEPLSPATDIYSTGLVAYEMLTGSKAVKGDSTMKTLARHINERPIQLPNDLSIPAELRSIVDTMLAKDRSERYAEVSEILDDLKSLDVEAFEASTPAASGFKLPAPPPIPDVSRTRSPSNDSGELHEEAFFGSDEVSIDFTIEALRDNRRLRIGLLALLVAVFFGTWFAFSVFDFESPTAEDTNIANKDSTNTAEITEKLNASGSSEEDLSVSEPVIDLAPARAQASRRVWDAHETAVSKIPDEPPRKKVKPERKSKNTPQKSRNDPDADRPKSRLKLRTLK